jgi:hypothetical protein
MINILLPQLFFGFVVQGTTTSKTFVSLQNIDTLDWLAGNPVVIPFAR